jgi:hypothetical protein
MAKAGRVKMAGKTGNYKDGQEFNERGILLLRPPQT